MNFQGFSFLLIHGGQLLNGLAGPTIMSAGPFLSTTWFSPDQRATATAVASLFSYLGGSGSFLVGPLLVPAPNDTKLAAAVSNGAIRDKIQLVMYAELAAIAVLFAAILLYFPSRPPVPPSVAAASQRLSYRSSICRLLREEFLHYSCVVTTKELHFLAVRAL
ncbi:Disrupted in renal carcinoma protein 2 -like protein [Takifugu flavidus]|uniref:Disrupted in renal carcinoma protein 2-like protein n=1 Tax=Takifugu flavidus TaxID=433684 RepID=A0A5C6PN42_9TELE|nr:Disrupted in renal carcinoma protein 2 -like protein [Takifugu flavidus]